MEKSDWYRVIKYALKNDDYDYSDESIEEVYKEVKSLDNENPLEKIMKLIESRDFSFNTSEEEFLEIE